MTFRRNLKRHKEAMNILADLVTDDSDDYEIVEILCRKLTELGYLRCKDGYYSRQKGAEKQKKTCFDCKYHFMSDFYLECNKHERINCDEICIDFELKE